MRSSFKYVNYFDRHPFKHVDLSTVYSPGIPSFRTRSINTQSKLLLCYKRNNARRDILHHTKPLRVTMCCITKPFRRPYTSPVGILSISPQRRSLTHALRKGGTHSSQEHLPGHTLTFSTLSIFLALGLFTTSYKDRQPR